MMRTISRKEAGSGATLSSPEDAKAERPAPLYSDNEQLPPDDKAEGDAKPDGADLLDRIHGFLRRFISYPSPEATIAHVLWIAHTHLMDSWFTTPRLAVLSPEPGSGKSRLLEITAMLVPRPILSVMSSPAYILRKIADQESRPTILYDEIDAIFGPQARGNEDLRAMVNAGYRRGATIGRCSTENGKVTPQELATYGAVAFGGLGDLPSTIMSRSIIIRMRKRMPDESVEPFRPNQHEPQGQQLHDELEAWAAAVVHEANIIEPILPADITDRDADVWMPLLAVADLADGRWPDVARNTALKFVRGANEGKVPSLGVQLLADVRRCFGAEKSLPTKTLLDRLLADDEAPWGDIRGGKLDPRGLAKMLGQFGIRSEGLRIGDATPKGYKREALHDAWKRYLPTLAETATDATSATDPSTTVIPDEADVSDVAFVAPRLEQSQKLKLPTLTPQL